MKRKYTSLLICTIAVIFLTKIFKYPPLVLKAFYTTTSLWFNNLVPFLFPFFIITDILNNYNLISYINILFGKIIHKIFKVPQEASLAFFMAMFSGFPGNSKLIKELLDKNRINEHDANKLLTFTHFSNPLFIIGTVGINFLNNKKIGFIILIIHFITNLIVGILFRNIYKENKVNYIKKESVPLSFVSLLKKSILNAINILFIIYGIILFFGITTTIINTVLNTNIYISTIINGLLEMTNGLYQLSTIDIEISIKATLSTFFISFGGLSIHMQVMSILSDYKINYYLYLLSRILHASISSILVYVIIKLIL